MKQIFNKYTVIVLSFYAFWIFGLPYLFSLAVPIVCENVSHNTDYTVEVEKPQIFLSPIPNAKIKIKNIVIKSKKRDDSTKIEGFETTVRILPLLSGKVHINNTKISNICINSVLAQELELDKNFFKNIEKAKFKLDKVEIKNAVVDIWHKNVNKPVVYTAHDIYYKKTSGALEFALNSEININDSTSQANINLYLPRNNDVSKSIVNISFDNFDVAPLGEYLRQYLPEDLQTIRGVIDINVNKQNLSAVFENCAIVMKDNSKSIILPKNLKINSKFNITSKVINFENIDIKSGTIDTSINGKIMNYLDNASTLVNLNFRLNKSGVEDIVKLLPPIITEDFNIIKLKHYKFFGDVIGNFTVKGNLFEPEVLGDVFISNGVLIKPIKNAGGATIKLSFTGKHVNFDVNVPAGGIERVWVKGGVELYNVKYSDMRIWSTKNVDLATAEEKVVPLHEILNFLIGPVPIMDVRGEGNIDITVKGNRKNPHVWGVLNFNNVATHFKDVPDLILSKSNAILTFNDQNVTFKTTKGFVNEKPVSISGICNLQGKFDFDVESLGQDIGYHYNAIKTSNTLLEDIKNILPKLDVCSGLANVKLKIYGTIIDINDIRFNENVFAKGNLELLGTQFAVQNLVLNNTIGNIKVDGLNMIADIRSYLGKSLVEAHAGVRNDIADIVISIPKLNLQDILPVTNDIKDDFGNIVLAVKAGYKGSISNIEYDRVNLVAKILSESKNNKLKLANGSILLKNNKLKIDNLKGSFIDSEGNFEVNLDVDNFAIKPRINGLIQLHQFNLRQLNTLSKYSIFPKELKEVKFEKGKINLNCRINNNKINAYSDLGGIAFVYTPIELPVKIVNGSLIIKNNSLRLNKLNILADNMPILIDGNIFNIFTKKNFDVYINSKPKQEFIDKYINKNQIYPVKIKGDIVYTLKTKGVLDNFDITGEINLAPDSSIYHLGATVGDIENAIVLDLDAKIIKNYIVKVKEFSYDKVISSLGKRNTRLNMLKAYGGIDIYKDDLVFHDLHIKTQNPTDARIFNIIFRKPNIKQGQFTSDLRFNGKLSNPKLIGDFHIFETNIPFLDTTMKNITFKFKDKTIDLSSKGEVLGNSIVVNAVLKNKLTIPYYVEKADLHTKLLDLNSVTKKIKLSQVDNFQTSDAIENIDLSSIVIRNMNLSADTIYLRNIVAEDFKAMASYNEKQTFSVGDFQFNIAKGTLNGAFNYNFNNGHTALTLKAKDINANDLTFALFDLNNQIYGDLTGDTKLTCSGSSFESCMQTLNGKTTFNVIDGRMPKLGSLEYLLKAGNLLKGGLTGVSINSIIDIISPLKTGDFSSIYGEVNIKDGVAHNIEIASRGKDLSLFISGNYNFATSQAEMEVFGMLSKKISTMFGPLGNISLNTLFNAIPGVDLSKNSALLVNINKIPGLELSNKAYRKFVAEIRGNINGENYVTSFKWIN